jgi:hypothetical protein
MLSTMKFIFMKLMNIKILLPSKTIFLKDNFN